MNEWGFVRGGKKRKTFEQRRAGFSYVLRPRAISHIRKRRSFFKNLLFFFIIIRRLCYISKHSRPKTQRSLRQQIFAGRAVPENAGSAGAEHAVHDDGGGALWGEIGPKQSERRAEGSESWQ